MSKYGLALRVLDNQELERRRVAPKLLVPPFISCRDDRTLAGDKSVVHADRSDSMRVVNLAVQNLQRARRTMICRGNGQSCDRQSQPVVVIAVCSLSAVAARPRPR